MKSHRSHEGYLMIDHRASPGLPDDIARKTGLDPAQTREGKLFETPTLTCSHCKCSVVKNPLRQRERAYCRKCDHYICDYCAMAADKPDYSHTPFDKIIDNHVNHAAKGVILGSPRELLDSPAPSIRET